MLVTAGVAPHDFREGDNVRTVPAEFSVSITEDVWLSSAS